MRPIWERYTVFEPRPSRYHISPRAPRHPQSIPEHPGASHMHPRCVQDLTRCRQDAPPCMHDARSLMLPPWCLAHEASSMDPHPWWEKMNHLVEDESFRKWTRIIWLKKMNLINIGRILISSGESASRCLRLFGDTCTQDVCQIWSWTIVEICLEIW